MNVPTKTTVLETPLKRRNLTAVLRIVVALWRSPLVRNGYALIASAGLTSVLGLVYWILAARLYTVEQVGHGAALISTLLALGNISQLNLGNTLNRFLPDAGPRSGRLILFAYAAGGAAALAISACSLLVIEFFVAELGFLLAEPWAAAGFVVATLCWTLFALQDSVLAGLRKSTVVPLENTLYAVAKIGLLVFLAGTAWLGSSIFAAWILPLPVMVFAVNFIIFQRFLPPDKSDSGLPSKLDMRAIARFLGWDYVGTLAMMTTLGLAPLLVLREVGPAALAQYHLAFTIAYSLYLIGRSMGISLLAEAVSDRTRMRAHVADAIVHTVIPLTAAVVFMVVAAPWIMALFGPAYAAGGTNLLRILALSCLPWGLVTIYLSAMRTQGRMKIVAIVQLATLMLVLGTGMLLLKQMGPVGMGIAWLVANTTVAIGIVVFGISKGGLSALVDDLLRVASSFARLISTLKSRGTLQSDVEAGNYPLQQLLQKSGEPGADLWRPLWDAPSQSDVQTTFLGDPKNPSSARADGGSSGVSRALLKISVTERGAASLGRHVAELQRLHADPRFTGCGFKLPEILAFERTPDSIRLIERVLPGEDGRITIQSPRNRGKALRAAVHAMAALHHRTATTTVIGEDWLRRWVDQPAGQLERPVCTLMTPQRRRDAIAAFRREQLHFWRGLVLPLGWGHGDFSPGNILFSCANDDPPNTSAIDDNESLMTTKVEAIIDWDRATTDAPPGFDASHLALTARATVSGEEFGLVVRQVLIRAKWTREEEEWLSAAVASDAGLGGWPHEPGANRAIAGLAWLHHVTANLEKSNRYARNRLWATANIERVLQVFLQSPVSR